MRDGSVGLMQIHFSKMQSLGNDFMVVDSSDSSFSLSPQEIHRVADRKHGIGFDQLLVVSKDTSGSADVFCRIFNADGGEAMQCGNGMRCIARFAVDHGLVASDTTSVQIRTKERVIGLEFLPNELIRADMGVPELEPAKIPFVGDGDVMDYPLHLNGKTFRASILSFGNPHAVIEVEELRNFPIEGIGSAVQKHPCFPNSVNVEFMQCSSRTHIELRVYERGVGETMACGSGACAAAWVAVQRGLTDPQVRVSMPGGSLDVACEDSGVWLTGTAQYVDEDQVFGSMSNRGRGK